MNKKILVLMFCMIFLVASVSAFEFDNIKQYDPENELITIKNSILGIPFLDLDTIVEIQLLENPACFSDCYAIWNVTSYDDKADLLGLMEFETIGGDMLELEHSFEYLAGYDQQISPTYTKDKCTILGNSSESCTYSKTGETVSYVERWESFNPKQTLTGNYLIKLKATKPLGIDIDWQPTIRGVNLKNEWAWWLSVTPDAYWKFNEAGTANAIEETTGVYNLTNSNSATFNTGHLNNAGYPNKGGTSSFTAGTILPASQFENNDFTISFWFNTTENCAAANPCPLFATRSPIAANPGISIQVETTTSALRLVGGTAAVGNQEVVLSAGNQSDGAWHHLAITRTTTNISMWLDGIVVDSNSTLLSAENFSSQVNMWAGSYNPASRFWSGGLDDMVIYNGTAATQEDITEIYNGGVGTEADDISTSSKVSVTLDSPADALSTINVTHFFESTASCNNCNLTNATINLWNNVGALFDSNFTEIPGASNSTNLTIQNISVGDYIWNVEYCGISQLDFNCSYGVNRTMTIQVFSENNATFNASAQETARESFILNITTETNILSVDATLNYNGTLHDSTSSCIGNECAISNTIDLPLIGGVESELHNFFWNITTFDGSSSIETISSTRIQNVSKIHLEQCNATFIIKTLNFSMFDESNLSRLMPMAFDGTFDYWVGSGTIKKNTSISDNVTEMNLCIAPNTTMNIDATIDYDEASNVSIYTSRFFYFDDKSINGVIEHIKLYLLKSTSSTSFILKVQDENLLPVADALIEIHRFYPGEGIFKIVQIAKTDDNGKSIGFFETETVDYKFVIKKAGETLLETEKQKVVPETSPFTLTFNTGAELGEPWSSQNPIPSLNSTLTWNEDTGIVTYTYVDSSGNFSSGRLLVQETSLVNSTAYSVLCNETSVLSSASLTCDVGNSTGFYLAGGYITRSAEGLDKQINFQIEDFSTQSGILGLFFGWFLILIAAFMFSFNEMAGIWAVTVTIFLVNLLGLIKFGSVFVTAIFGIALILTWLMER